MEKVFLETERLTLRRMVESDFPVLCDMLQDVEVMYAWEYTFSYEEVWQWILRSFDRYEQTGLSYFLAIDKETKEVVGQIALLGEKIEGKEYLGVGYMLRKKYWGKGYATEGAKACVEYAFQYLHVPEVIADIRPMNRTSRAVAERLGMTITKEFVKIVRDKPMFHLMYSLKNPVE